MDLNDDVTFKGSWQTVSRKGGITISVYKYISEENRILFYSVF